MKQKASDLMAPEPDVAALVNTLMLGSAQQNVYVLNQLVDSFRLDSYEYQATLRLIRDTIEDLFAYPYMPSQRSVLDALYPPGERINALVQEMMDHDGVVTSHNEVQTAEDAHAESQDRKVRSRVDEAVQPGDHSSSNG
jgi:hypothetical protein